MDIVANNQLPEMSRAALVRALGWKSDKPRYTTIHLRNLLRQKQAQQQAQQK